MQRAMLQQAIPGGLYPVSYTWWAIPGGL